MKLWGWGSSSKFSELSACSAAECTDVADVVFRHNMSEAHIDEFYVPVTTSDETPAAVDKPASPE